MISLFGLLYKMKLAYMILIPVISFQPHITDLGLHRGKMVNGGLALFSLS